MPRFGTNEPRRLGQALASWDYAYLGAVDAPGDLAAVLADLTAEVERLTVEKQAIPAELGQYDQQIAAIRAEQTQTIRPVDERLVVPAPVEEPAALDTPLA